MNNKTKLDIVRSLSQRIEKAKQDIKSAEEEIAECSEVIRQLETD